MTGLFIFFSRLISRYNVLNEDDIQGEEEGTSGMDGDVKVSERI